MSYIEKFRNGTGKTKCTLEEHKVKSEEGDIFVTNCLSLSGLL